MREDDVHHQYARHIERVNRATDTEINKAMDEILRRQRETNVLRPASDRFRLIRRTGSFMKVGSIPT